ncbi:hypothetical protein HAX54_025533 [Datura stramonium]|uniref:Uncharacterized protein n=1 Tax=Datura stramonium TaxID=4076 RepID=A0ABS8RKN0_DATST|nr:hypothetical protein [Datura stramonium]
MARHTSDGGFDGCQPGNGPSVLSLRSIPFSLWATEVPMDRQVSDNPSRQLSIRPEVQAIRLRKDGILIKLDGGDDGPLGLRRPVTFPIRHNSDMNVVLL